MITYNIQRYGVLSVVKLRGSVFPKAITWAISNAILAWALHRYTRSDAEGAHWDMTGVNEIWGGYTAVLGFLIVFRNNQAYTRFWEGATLINQVRGEWFNAVSTLFTFCNHTEESQKNVEKFQGTLVRLMSLLHSSALQQVCELQDDRLEIIENEGMELASLNFLQESNDRCEILMQWVQRLIVDADEAKTLKVAPPLLTRAFQELSRGIVNLNNARKIKEIPFPFPYAQMITCMLLVQWMMNPLLASQAIGSALAAAATCFFVTFGYWCLIYIALEIDQPFGEDANDLPLREMQRDFNRSLLSLMHPLAQKVPAYRSLERAKVMRGDSMFVHSSQEPGFVEKSPPLTTSGEVPKKGHSAVSLSFLGVFRSQHEEDNNVEAQRSWTLGRHARAESEDGTISDAETGMVPSEPSVQLAPPESSANAAKSKLRHYQRSRDESLGNNNNDKLSSGTSLLGGRNSTSTMDHARTSQSQNGTSPAKLGREGPPGLEHSSTEGRVRGSNISNAATAANSTEHGTASSTRESTLETPSVAT